ncbi:MAG TPA: DUF4418 family protein [Clostridia bacterium]|nr:DUF4418 family protein [Clostridia bacterium]
MKNRIFSGVFFTLSGSLIALGPQFLFKVCERMGDKTMKCFWTSRAELGIGALIAVAGLFLLLARSNQFRLGINLSIMLAGILAVLVPTVLIGVCSMPTMQCRLLTLPSILIISILIETVSAINILFLVKTYKKPAAAI